MRLMAIEQKVKATGGYGSEGKDDWWLWHGRQRRLMTMDRKAKATGGYGKEGKGDWWL